MMDRYQAKNAVHTLIDAPDLMGPNERNAFCAWLENRMKTEKVDTAAELCRAIAEYLSQDTES